MIDPRDSVPALLELASQAATDGVRATALRRIALLAEEELGRARSHADLDAMRESLRPALPALRAHAAVSGTLALFERHSRAESHASTRPAVQSPLVRTISHAMTLGVPSLVASPVVSDSRAARCVRRLLQASPDRFSGIADDAGCLACAVLLRDLDRVSARAILEVLGDRRTSIPRVARFVPAAEDGLARWTHEFVMRHHMNLAAAGESLVVSLVAHCDADVAAALLRRTGRDARSVANVPAPWTTAVAALVEGAQP